jgi:GTP-binding protein
MNAKFIISCPKVENCPVTEKPEFAFIGRSNVGKSSLINMLTSQNKLAKTSQKPGKTQLINLFSVDEKWLLADLPGYGYAKTSKENREKWDIMIRQYLLKRENLYCVFVLIDSNIPPQEKDLEFLRWLGTKHVAFALIFTKTDRITKNKVASAIASYKKVLMKDWESLPPFFVSSSVSKSGKEEILKYIEELVND